MNPLSLLPDIFGLRNKEERKFKTRKVCFACRQSTVSTVCERQPTLDLMKLGVRPGTTGRKLEKDQREEEDSKVKIGEQGVKTREETSKSREEEEEKRFLVARKEGKREKR